jgi:3-oxoacyl-[acyl-carrier-protein] synthase II
MKRRVVITGMGAITPLADTLDGLFASQIAGQSGVGPITRFDASAFPTTFAAEVHNFDLGSYVADCGRWRDAGVNSQFAAAAAQLALAHAGILENSNVDRRRFGVYLGAGEGIQDFHKLMWMVAEAYRPELQAMDYPLFCSLGTELYDAGWEIEQELHRPAGHLSGHFELRGPNYSCLTACAAGSQALGEAAELIRDGAADVMLAGGTHSMIHPLGVMGFNLLTALSTRNDDPPRASRPFELRRDGFVIGEGAGLLVLEELDHARRRGATIHAELTGYGASADAYRVTDCHPEGRGAIACMRAALADAGLAPHNIGYINAHGTGTQINDRVETAAIKQVFGDHARRLPISSSKSMLGHLIGAAGAVELIISVLAMQRGILPPTINYEDPDPACDLDYVPNKPREARVDHVLSNSFGFGGQNVSLIVSRFEARSAT